MWTAPRTWVTDETVTAPILNTHVRDNQLAAMHPYDFSGADVDVANSNVETSIYSKVVTGGDMGANGVLRLELTGDYLFNNNIANTVTLRIKFGGSTVIQDAWNIGNLDAARAPWIGTIEVANKAATNSQLVTFWFKSVRQAAPTTGIGSIAGEGASRYSDGLLQNTAAVDTTADQTLQVTAQWNAANANNSWRRRLAVLRLGQN